MKKLIFLVGLLASVLLLPQAAMAAKIKPVIDQPIPKELSLEEAKKGIIEGGLKRNWIIEEQSENLMKADIYVRKHYVAVNIKLHDGSYDIEYLDSENMKYQPDGTIHRKYNGWVSNLNSDIQNALRRVARLKDL
ncbi:hypothetical protein [Agarivorans gilvus]|uniref:Lipoprotein n=1 Tax=Agarivorans gilvus TaxID=680279 RepID=A0ABQ1I1M2_9ALTE|nr:hypothetical protein [Agarivorans gilvus]GGB07884.1 lipoprotein [Agarivorans gilvus]